jgi:hypothetical protein
MNLVQALPVLSHDLEAGRIGQGSQFIQRVLDTPGWPGPFEFDTDQKGALYGCRWVGDITPPRLCLLRCLPLFGLLLSRALAQDLPDRHLYHAPAKVTLCRIMLGTFFSMFLQPRGGQRVIEGKRLATVKTLDV